MNKKSWRVWGILFFLIAFLSGAALYAHAASLNFSTAEPITLSSYPATLTIATSSVADVLQVNAASVLVTLSSAESFTLLSPSYDLSVATSSGGGAVAISCSGGIETAIFSQTTGLTVYTVTPTTQNCASASSPTVTVTPTVIETGGSSSYGIEIDGGATSTVSTNVTLSLYGTGAYMMELSNMSNFASSTWMPYVTSMPWTFASNLGNETVYVQFRSIGGTVTGSAQASIDLVSATSSPSVSLPLPPQSSPSAASLAAELQSLETQLAALEAQASAQGMESLSGVNAGMPLFTRNLQLGMSGTDAKELQQFLIFQNSGPAAQKLKAHGMTRYFGSLTRNALIEFQKKTGITPAIGYFGPITRKEVNGLSP